MGIKRSKPKCMKSILLFEGIASSGKTTLEKLLIEELKSATIISEGKTLMPLIDNVDKNTAIQHLHTILEESNNIPEQTLILDRFHLTHCYRTKSKLESFYEIENQLLDSSKILLILLTIDESMIEKRIRETMSYRKNDWQKGAKNIINFQEKIIYYNNQQEQLIRLFTESKLPKLKINTSQKDWNSYTELIQKNVST